MVELYGEDGKTLHEGLDWLLASETTPPHVKVDILKFKLERLGGKTPQAIDVAGSVGVDLARKVIHKLYPGPTKSPEA